MIIDSVFKEFINVVRENKNYTIGLLNGEGDVVDCSDENLIGTHRDINNSDIHNLFYPVKAKNFDYGYLWLSGNDENLSLMGNLISDSLNIRLTYEITQSTLKQNITEDDKLVKLLLDEESFDMDRILGLIEEMGFDQSRSRIAIYIVNEQGFDNRKIAKLKLMPDGEDNLCSLLSRYALLIFKAVPDNLENQQMKNYVGKFLKMLKDLDVAGDGYWIGSVQKKLRNYKQSYRHCLWLKDNEKENRERTVWFMDFLYDYFMSEISLGDVKDVFDYYHDFGKDTDMDELIQIADSLLSNNFNISQTAESLYLHKNTLVYKLKKYEELFHIDIRGDFKGRFLFILISASMKEYRKRRRVGEEV